jgi:hypothetical protein
MIVKREPFLIRQGDVGLISVNSIPEDAKEQPRENGAVVLAYGEATGHKHQLLESGILAFKAANADVFLRIAEPATLRHEEHTHISVPPGTYRVLRQREWTDAEEPILVED